MTIMTLFCRDISDLFLFSTDLFAANIAQAQEHGNEELFLVRIISIDQKNHQMTLELLNDNAEIKNIIYDFKYQSIPESLKKDDIIRIWGVINKETNLEGKEKSENNNIRKTYSRYIINGNIAGSSNKNPGDDPTGVRKRLRRLLIHQPFKRGGRGGGQP